MSIFNKNSTTPTWEPTRPAPSGIIDPPWLAWARKELGIKEGAGSGNNPRVIWYHSHSTEKYKQDSIAWCASFVNSALEETGFKSTNSEWAQSYTNYGEKLSKPIHGCIVVFRWNKDNGHVTFYDATGKGILPCLGGNQSDQVMVQDYGSKLGSIVGYRWPVGAPKPGDVAPKPEVPSGSFPAPIKGWDKAYSKYIYDNVTPAMISASKSSLVSNYKDYDQRLLIAKIFEAIAYAESGHDRTTRFVETGISDKDLVTGKQNVSEGLLQLSYQDSKLYGARFDWAKDKNLDPKDPSKTIFDPYKNLECGILIFDKQILRHGENFQTAGARYWSTLRPGDGLNRTLSYLKKVL